MSLCQTHMQKQMWPTQSNRQALQPTTRWQNTTSWPGPTCFIQWLLKRQVRGTARRSNWSRRFETARRTSLAIHRKQRICFSSCPWHFKGEMQCLFKYLCCQLDRCNSSFPPLLNVLAVCRIGLKNKNKTKNKINDDNNNNYICMVHSVITFFNCFPPPAEDISLSQIIPSHSIVSPYTPSWSQ